MSFYVHARDTAGRIVLRRNTMDAAVKKAEELEHHGCFEVEIESRLDGPERRGRDSAGDDGPEPPTSFV